MNLVQIKHNRRRMLVRLFRFHKEEEGAVMVEFAIVAPLFIFMITGTIQLMGIAHADAVLQYANYMALRAGVVHYENINKRWDPDRNSSSSAATRLNKDLTKEMEAAAWHAMGPFSNSIAGFESLSSLPNITGSPMSIPGLDRPISNAPAAAFNVQVTAGTLDVTNQSKFMPIWLTSQTRVDLGLPMPWVGRVIAVMSRINSTTPNPTEQQMTQHGNDPFSNVSEPFSMIAADLIANAYSMDWMPITSDAYLDQRNNNYENRVVLWPLQGRSITVHFDNGLAPWSSASHPANINTDNHRTQPITMPVQSRFRP